LLKKLKNIVTGILIISAIVIVFRTQDDVKHDNKTHINYWFVAGKKDDIPYSALQFNKSQDSIYVECTPIPWNEHEKKLLTSILSESPPDVVMLVSTVPKWAARRALVNLDAALVDPDFDSTQFYETLWEEMHYDGSVYAVPCYTASYAFFYNKDIFKEAGLDPEKPPKTWEELKEYSKKITLKNKGKLSRIGYIPNYGNLETSFVMALELGAEFKNSAGKKVNLTDTKVIKAFNEELELFNGNSVEEVNAFMGSFGYGSQHGFISGKIGMMILDNTFIDQIKLYNPELNYGVAEIPAFEGTGTKSSTGSWWYAIPRGAKNKKAAWEFIKYCVRNDVQLEESLSMEQSLFPANVKTASSQEFLKEHFAMGIFDKQMQNTKSKVIFPLIHDVFWREFSMARERILYKKQTPYDALKQAEKTIQSNLDRAIEYDNYVQSKLPFENFK